LWWYVDAISDDGGHALTIIAFVGSVFSPYYAWALKRNPNTPAENHCAINVALYGGGARRWAMTERGAAQMQRSERTLKVGPSELHWDGSSLLIELDELSVPLPQRVLGRVRIWPQALSTFNAALDVEGRHRWGPIAPCSRIEVDMVRPGLKWCGHAYLDSNEGDEPIAGPFARWDWSRGNLRDGSSAVVYDVRPKLGDERVIAHRFYADGRHEPFEAPPRQGLPSSKWRVARNMRSAAGQRPVLLQTLEDTPFYTRSVVNAALLGEAVTSVHESLDIPRLVSPATQWMLPWRMPRRARF
jgi:carotenoid 1,2-hydratase